MDEEKKKTERQKVNELKSNLRTRVELALSSALSTVPTDDAPEFLSVAQTIKYEARVPKGGGRPSVIVQSPTYKRAGVMAEYLYPMLVVTDYEQRCAAEVNRWVEKLVKASVEDKKAHDRHVRCRRAVEELADEIGADRDSLCDVIRFHEKDADDPEDEDGWNLNLLLGYSYPSIRLPEVAPLARALVAAGIVKTPAEVAAEKQAQDERRKVESVCGAMYGMCEGKPGRFPDSEARESLAAHGWDVKAALADLMQKTAVEQRKEYEG